MGLGRWIVIGTLCAGGATYAVRKRRTLPSRFYLKLDVDQMLEPTSAVPYSYEFFKTIQGIEYARLDPRVEGIIVTMGKHQHQLPLAMAEELQELLLSFSETKRKLHEYTETLYEDRDTKMTEFQTRAAEAIKMEKEYKKLVYSTYVTAVNSRDFENSSEEDQSALKTQVDGGNQEMKKTYKKWLKMVKKLESMRSKFPLFEIDQEIGRKLADGADSKVKKRFEEKMLSNNMTQNDASYHLGNQYTQCFTTRMNTSQYILASGCDKVSLMKLGAIDLAKPARSLTYFNDFFKKYGIQFQEVKTGTRKNVYERFTRSSPSNETKQEYKRINDSLMETIQLLVKTTRSGGNRDWKVPFSPMIGSRKAKDLNLVDEVVYLDQFEADIAPSQASHFSEIAIPYVSIPMYWRISNFERKRKKGKDSSPSISIIELNGAISQDSSQIARIIRHESQNPKVDGIVIRIDSPGGEAVASEVIRREIESASTMKPLCVSMGSVAASGGYLASVGSNKIFADRSTITGSIGVIIGKPIIGKALKDMGINIETIGPEESNIFSITKEWNADELRIITRSCEDMYDDFLTQCSRGRGLSKDDIRKLAGGAIYTGSEALKNDLIDEIGGLRDAVRYVSDSPMGQVKLRYPQAGFNFNELLEWFGVSRDL